MIRSTIQRLSNVGQAGQSHRPLVENNNMILTFDIETLPCADTTVIAELTANIKPPGSIKKAESIAAWMAENREEATTEAVAKTSFDGMFGRIACICYAFDDGEVFSVDCNDSGDEMTMLAHFYSHVFDMSGVLHNRGTAELAMTFCGHNIVGFDLPFLKHRSIILGIKPPMQLFKAMNAKPWDSCIADTMLMWSSDPHKRGSMDRLCKALGIAGKDGFDGSMVAATWPTEPGKVIDYCKKDVEKTRQIYKRLTFA